MPNGSSLIRPDSKRIIGDNISESLTHVLKYTQANSVTVTIEVMNKFVKAEVKDDGVGADIIRKGIGICGMMAQD